MSSQRKTIEEHREYMEELARLSFHFAWQLQDKLPEENMSDIIRLHTPLYWHGLEYPANTPREEFTACDANSAGDFEEKMWKQAGAVILSRAEECYPYSVGMEKYLRPEWNWNCGSLKYDPPHPNPALNGCCVFHIANAVAPESLFNVPGHLLECFEKLVHDSEKEFGYTTLYTGTWLNERKEFLAYFPQEWRDNLTPVATKIPSWNFGDWGQIITARGTFNRKAGEFIRENGYLKYNCRWSRCSFENMKLHLNDFKKGC